MTREEMVRLVTRMVVERLQKGPSIPIGVSNRHIHLCRADMDILFGAGSELTRMKDLGQPGQYACEEVVSIRSAKGQLNKVRILGPLREETQVEISVADGYTLGIKPPVRESGSLDDTPGIELIGPSGSVHKQYGVIAALRHIHMSPGDAETFGVKDKDIVRVTVGDNVRAATFSNVLVRVSEKYQLEMHIDVDEANAVGVKTGGAAYIFK